MEPDRGGLPRTVVLVTGMSGTGKSTVLVELARRGHAAVDTDDPGWIVRSPEHGEPLWDLARVVDLIGRHRTGALFVAGCVANQGALYPRFDAVVLLSAPVQVLFGRVADRANPYGSTAADRTRIAADLATFECRLRAGATHEIVATAPVLAVVRRLELIAADIDRTGDRPPGPSGA